MLIKVTQEHIDKGLENVCSNRECVLALAFREAGFENVHIGGNFLSFNGIYGRKIIIPSSLQNKHMEILRWNKGDSKPNPFKFTIRSSS